MPFVWNAATLSGLNVMSLPQSNASVFPLPSVSRFSCCTALIICGTAAVSTVSGDFPINPSTVALSVAWPLPVAPRLPIKSIVSLAAFSAAPVFSNSCRKRAAARMGPTVWLELGPMPTRNISKILMGMVIPKKAAEPFSSRLKVIKRQYQS